MQKTACMWIRDGVLINRMHVNPVAFAAAYWLRLSKQNRKSIGIETLINFGFEKSGFSCAEKMRLFNEEKANLLEDVSSAADLYNDIAGAAGALCNYFNFAPELLNKLRRDGCKNFITSALDQKILDDWIATEQGLRIKDSLAEMLGKRDGFSKGYDHFKYASLQTDGGRIFYIADAISEIATASKYATKFSITTIGFAYHIDADAVEQAYEIVSSSHELPVLDKSRLTLPEPFEIVGALKSAGADAVVMGSAENIFANLAIKLKNI